MNKQAKTIEKKNEGHWFFEVLEGTTLFLLDTAALSLKLGVRNYPGQRHFTGKDVPGFFRQLLVVSGAYFFIRMFVSAPEDVPAVEKLFLVPEQCSSLIVGYSYLYVLLLIIRGMNAAKYSRIVPRDFPGVSLLLGPISGITSSNIRTLGTYHYSDRYDIIITFVEPPVFFAVGYGLWWYYPDEAGFGMYLMISSAALLIREVPQAYARFKTRKDHNESKKMGHMSRSKNTLSTASMPDFSGEAQIL